MTLLLSQKKYLLFCSITVLYLSTSGTRLIATSLTTINPFLLPAATWSKTYSSDIYQSSTSVKQTADGGYITAGWISDFGGNIDVDVLKTDPSGNPQWHFKYGGPNADIAYSVIQTSPDLGYAVAGFTTTQNGPESWIIKLRPSGALQWEFSFGPLAGNPPSAANFAIDVLQKTDGTIAVLGTLSLSTIPIFRPYIVLISPQGSLISGAFYNLGNPDTISICYSFKETADSGFILAGTTSNALFGGVTDILTLKTDNQLNIQWVQIIGTPSVDMSFSITKTGNNAFTLVGYTNLLGTKDALIINITDTGATQWFKLCAGMGEEALTSVHGTSDGGFAAAGSVTDSIGYQDFWLIKFDQSGNPSFQFAYGGTIIDESLSMQQTADNGFILAGYSNSFGSGLEMGMVKIDSTGGIAPYNPSSGGRRTTTNILIISGSIVPTIPTSGSTTLLQPQRNPTNYLPTTLITTVRQQAP
ncbi:MAG: hypothetical protein HY606_14565 [Planctomycetes bacterium]|nr:hypothetical protein [Planctomycetota bacterium]